jgi:3',5'-cyclic AMP phosphodiesterase CpdA
MSCRSRIGLTGFHRGRAGGAFGRGCTAWFLLLLIGWFCTADALAGTEEGFSVVVLPDTQIYAWKHPELFHAQTRWIAENRVNRNIRYVLHLGDVVEHNNEEEWKIAREAFSLLDGEVPYAIALGNHDMGPNGSARSRDTLFGRYFPVEDFKKWKSFGGVYDTEPEKGDNSFHIFRAGGRDWLVLSLEFGPRNDVLRWANEVIGQHPKHPVILITHAYLDNDGRRYDRAISKQQYPPQDYPIAGDEAGLNTGEDIWRKLVAKNRNTVMVVSGHVCVAARLTSKGDAGNRVHQMVVDYQDQERGGNGWLRLLQFSEGGRRVNVRDYSPVLDDWSDHPDRRFDFDLDLP